MLSTKVNFTCPLDSSSQPYPDTSLSLQICMTMSVSCQMPVLEGGGAGKVAYIDTEGTFRPDRIIPIAQRFNLDAESVLGNIVHARAYNFEHQMGEYKSEQLQQPVYGWMGCELQQEKHEFFCFAKSELNNLQTACPNTFAEHMEPLQDPFKLLVMDSLTSNFRSDFCGRGELAERQQKLGQMLNRLRK
eukprot:scaffold4189_cov14-Tisochrysis_lutea.AAC.1